MVLSLITLNLEEDFFCRGLKSKVSLFALINFDSLIDLQCRVLIRKSGSLCEINIFLRIRLTRGLRHCSSHLCIG